MKNTNFRANVNDLIILGCMLEEFEDFNKNLIKFKSSKHIGDYIYKLTKLSKGEFVFLSRRVKKFYEENRNVFDTINEYSKVWLFLVYNYDKRGNMGNHYDLDFFYQYMLKHKEELEKILLLLGKMKQLGFDVVIFDENYFKKNEFKFNINSTSLFNLIFLDNIEIIPNYDKNVIKYKTVDSNYAFEMNQKFEKSIVVNSLLFDSNKLPNTIDRKLFINKLLDLKMDIMKSCEEVKNSTDLSLGINDLSEQVISVSDIFENLDGINSKKELLEILSNIKENIKKLESISEEYDASLIKDGNGITKELLEKEKSLKLQRKYEDNLHVF